MIIDCFPFFNEIDLLKIRLKLLNKIVDRVVLVGSSGAEACEAAIKMSYQYFFDRLHLSYQHF